MKVLIMLLVTLLLPFPCNAGWFLGPSVRTREVHHHYYGVTPATAMPGWSYSSDGPVYSGDAPSVTVTRTRVKSKHHGRTVKTKVRTAG